MLGYCSWDLKFSFEPSQIQILIIHNMTLLLILRFYLYRLCLKDKMETKVNKRLMEVAGHSINRELFEDPVPALLIWDGSMASAAHLSLCLGAKGASVNPARKRLSFPFKYFVLSTSGRK